MTKNRYEDFVQYHINIVKTSKDYREILAAAKRLAEEVFYENEALRLFVRHAIECELDELRRWHPPTDMHRPRQLLEEAYLDILTVLSYHGVHWHYVVGRFKENQEFSLFATGWSSFVKVMHSDRSHCHQRKDLVVFYESDATALAKKWSDEAIGQTTVWEPFPAGASYPSNKPYHPILSYRRSQE